MYVECSNCGGEMVLIKEVFYKDYKETRWRCLRCRKEISKQRKLREKELSDLEEGRK